MRRESMWLILFVFLCSCTKDKGGKKIGSPQYVEVEKAFRVSKSVIVKLPGIASRISRHQYVVNLSVPQEIINGIQSVQEAQVILPFVNSPRQTVLITKNTSSAVSVRLENQIHDLSDQEVDVELKLKTPALFEVAFSSIYTPMGKDAYVFVVDAGIVQKIKVAVIQLTEAGRILIVSDKIQNGSNIVRRGLDNLIDGDRVISEVANEF